MIGIYIHILERENEEGNKMARKKLPPAGETGRRESDGRFNNPLDARIQKKRLDKALRKLREQT